MDFDEKLINSVERRRPLYDNRPNFTNRNQRVKLWKEVSEEVNARIKDCQTGWVKLRQRYIKERNKSRPSFWKYMDRLSFLQPFIENGRTTSSLVEVTNLPSNSRAISKNTSRSQLSVSTSVSTKTRTSVVETPPPLFHTKLSVSVKNNLFVERTTSQGELANLSSNARISSNNTTHSQLPVASADLTIRAEASTSFLSQNQSNSNKRKENEESNEPKLDSVDRFLLSLAPTMRQFSSIQRLGLQIEMQAIVMEALKKHE